MSEPAPSPLSAVSVSDMARMLGLSRSRYHQLLKGGVMPPPKVDPETKRPFYDSDGQALCLQVRQTNRGVNGKRVMFYSRSLGPHLVGFKPRPSGAQRSSSARKKKEPSKKADSSKPNKLDLLVEGLKGLGLPNVTRIQATQAIHACFPIDAQPPSDEVVLLKVFRYLSRQNRGDSHGP